MNPVGWFEIPVSDMKRAIGFYNKVFGYDLEVNKMGELDMAWLPWEQDGPGAAGSLVYHKEFYKPSTEGTLVYFSCEDVQDCLDRVEDAGGKILVGKRLIKEDIGYMGVMLDTEGSRVALHSRK